MEGAIIVAACILIAPLWLIVLALARIAKALEFDGETKP
jgi:hypothetical protein